VKIISIEYSLAYYSLDIYVSGCKPPHCNGCHNPEAWSFCSGVDYTKEYFDAKIKKKISKNKSLINKVMIFGGEPLDQNPNHLESLLSDIKSIDNIELWLFTGHAFEFVPEFVKKYCDVIKCGKYVDKLKTDNGNSYCGVKLATSNQKFYTKGKDF